MYIAGKMSSKFLRVNAGPSKFQEEHPGYVIVVAEAPMNLTSSCGRRGTLTPYFEEVEPNLRQCLTNRDQPRNHYKHID